LQPRPYSGQEIELIYAEINKNGIYKGVYKAVSLLLQKKGFQRTPEAIRKFFSRNHGLNRNNLSEAEELGRPIHALVENNLDEHLQKIRSMRDSNLSVMTEKFIKIGNPTDKARIKIACVGDLHIPLENHLLLDKLIKEEADADILVLNGDIFEHYIVSRWKKDKSIPLRLEYEIALEWIKKLSAVFPKIILVYGNHEYRLASYFSTHVDPAVHFATSPDMLKRLADGYDFDKYNDFVKIHDFPNVHYEPGTLNWYTKIGKCLFVHPRDAISKTLGTAEKAMNHFISRGEDFQCLVMGHTHRQSSAVLNKKLLLESGCCCVPLDYESDGKLNSMNQVFGYTLVYMDQEGNVDYDKTHNVFYGTGSPIKTSDPLEHIN